MAIGSRNYVRGRVHCPSCQYWNRPARTLCKRCKNPLRPPEEESVCRIEFPILLVEERAAILERCVKEYVEMGYRVIARSETTAQLVKPRTLWYGPLSLGMGGGIAMSYQWVDFAACLFFVALLLYFGRKEPAVYLAVDSVGEVERIAALERWR